MIFLGGRTYKIVGADRFRCWIENVNELDWKVSWGGEDERG